MSPVPDERAVNIFGLPWSAWTFVIGSILSIVIWSIKLDSQVDELTRRVNMIDHRVDRMDNDGSRKLGIVEDRQNTNIRRLDEINQRIDRLMKYFTATPPP